jgi:hypothetical protein
MVSDIQQNIKASDGSSRSNREAIAIFTRLFDLSSFMTNIFSHYSFLSSHSLQFPNALLIELSPDELHLVLILDLLLQTQQPPLLSRTQLAKSLILLLQRLLLRLGRVARALLGQDDHRGLGQQPGGGGLAGLA